MKSGSNLKNEDVMKKVLYMVMGGLLNAMCFSACNSDLLNTVGPEADEQADGKVTVAAIIVNEDDTKIALGDDTGKSTKVYWSPDDAIALVNGEERYVFERSDDKSESQTAEFSYDSKSGNLPSIQTAGLKFVYPCIEPASYAKQPGTKEGIGDYIGMEASVPAGVSEYEGIKLTFEHSAAIVKLVLNNDDFKNKKVTVRLYADGLMPEDNMIATEPIDADASGSVTAYIAIPASGIALKNCTIYASTDAGVYETSLSDKTLSAGRLYRISKNNLIESDCPIYQAVPSNQIWYTSQSQASFGSSPADSKILSHTFDEGTQKGVITFESDITTINNSAFVGNGSFYLETVSLPDGIESFGTSVFSQKGYLTTVNLPKKLQSIPDWTFLKCVKLADINIPASVKSIGYQAFYACTSIDTITLPAGLQSIGASAFYGCSSLTSIYCESPVPPTGSDYMFAGHASGRKIYVPSGSAEAYKKAKYWSEYSTSIEEY